MRICIDCNEESDSFYTKNSNICKDCKKIKAKKYYYENNDKVKKYRDENKDKISENNINYLKERRVNKKDEIKEYRKKYYEENKEVILEQQKKSAERRKDKIKIQRAKAYKEKDQKVLYQKMKEKMNNDPILKASCRIRILILNSINKMGYTKRSRTHEILGCDFTFFKEYIENQFLEGMSWDNHGKWHLDHKTPVSWAKDEEELLLLNYYTNFQPLWAFDNLSKNNKWSGKQNSV